MPCFCLTICQGAGSIGWQRIKTISEIHHEKIFCIDPLPITRPHELPHPVGMPVMNGHELFYRLKQLDPKLPIIISSGFGEANISS